MASIRGKIDVLLQVERNAEEGAQYANTASEQLKDMAAELQQAVQDSETGERAMYVVQEAADEMAEISASLSEAGGRMQDQIKLLRS